MMNKKTLNFKKKINIKMKMINIYIIKYYIRIKHEHNYTRANEKITSIISGINIFKGNEKGSDAIVGLSPKKVPKIWVSAYLVPPSSRVSTILKAMKRVQMS
jgi:hypothetical protein